MLRPEIRTDDVVEIYVPEYKTIVRFFGAGDENLSQEDFDDGCVDSIYYDLWRSVDAYVNHNVNSDDGGLICLKEHVNSKESLLDWVPRVLEFIFTDSADLRWRVVTPYGVAHGTTLRIRFACENQLLGDYALAANAVCGDNADFRDEIGCVHIRERRLDEMLDRLTVTLHGQNLKVLRPGVRIGTHVTCEHCEYCERLRDRPGWISCRRSHFYPTIATDASLSFFCAEGIPKEE